MAGAQQKHFPLEAVRVEDAWRRGPLHFPAPQDACRYTWPDEVDCVREILKESQTNLDSFCLRFTQRTVEPRREEVAAARAPKRQAAHGPRVPAQKPGQHLARPDR